MRISTEKINWRIALGELLLIVVGILMALAIDSYADTRADQAQAAVYLEDLVIALQTDKSDFESNHLYLEKITDNATHLLGILEGKDQSIDDPGRFLLAAIGAEGITREPAIWVEMQMTGALRLISNPDKRTAVVSYYLDRANSTKTINENFVPAVRDLRALAWDVMPIGSFETYFRSLQSGSEGNTGVPGTTVMAGLQSRDDAIYLLKRVIVTSGVTRVNLKRSSDKAAALISELQGSDH